MNGAALFPRSTVTTTARPTPSLASAAVRGVSRVAGADILESVAARRRTDGSSLPTTLLCTLDHE
jgi:hypothetical protein